MKEEKQLQEIRTNFNVTSKDLEVTIEKTKKKSKKEILEGLRAESESFKLTKLSYLGEPEVCQELQDFKLKDYPTLKEIVGYLENLPGDLPSEILGKIKEEENPKTATKKIEDSVSAQEKKRNNARKEYREIFSSVREKIDEAITLYPELRGKIVKPLF